MGVLKRAAELLGVGISSLSLGIKSISPYHSPVPIHLLPKNGTILMGGMSNIRDYFMLRKTHERLGL